MNQKSMLRILWIVCLLMADWCRLVESQTPVDGIPTAPFVQAVALPTFAPVSKAPTVVKTTDAPITTPPSIAPAVAPVTDRPVIQPTDIPTLAPTSQTPTMAPITPSPTILPTLFPTTAPTNAPTVTKSNAPSNLPSTIPSISPQPTTATKNPTISPMPTIAPTITLTDAPVTPAPTRGVSSDTVNVVFRVQDISNTLDTKAESDFESVAKNLIAKAFETVNGIQIVEIAVAVYNQNLIATRHLRQLLPLRIGINVFLEYRSVGSTNVAADDPNEWVGMAFNSPEKRDTFARELRRKNSFFTNVRSILVSVDGETPTEDSTNPIVSQQPPPDDNSVNLWIILVASIGGGACVIALLLVVFVVVRRKSSDDTDDAYMHKPTSSKKKKTSNHTTGLSSQTKPSESELQFAAEIRCENRADDISTLGDPVGWMQYGAVAPRDERTASVGADYDYAKHAGAIGRQNSAERSSGMPSTLGPMQSLLADDDRSFEQQFENNDTEQRLEFQVPPGKLGMVIDTPDGSPPLVHAIKTGSVLDGKVQVGDLLISVDHQNVSDWSAIQVSKWISARSDQQRTLVFGRNSRRRTESSVFLEDGSV